MDQEQLAEILKDIEDEKALGKVTAVSVFRSLLNQPDFVSISSANATDAGSVDGYFKFNVNMPRPVLEAETLQLLNANIPLATQNIPDTACVFWYYRLSTYSGKLPNINNLYFIRLLPSYYRPEFIPEAEEYGFNQTFAGFTDLASQLALACQKDLALDNYTGHGSTNDNPTNYRIQYLPGEGLLTYNSDINKFQFNGNEGETRNDLDPVLYAETWSASETYAVNDRIKSPTYVQGEGFIVYKALLAHTNQALPTYPDATNTYWTRDFLSEGVANYSGTTPYFVGRYVSYNNTLYRCVQNTYGNLPTNTSYWAVWTADYTPLYQYLVTGYNDPNVAVLQGQGQRGYSTYALYEEGDNILYDGITYEANYGQIQGTPWLPSDERPYNPSREYTPGSGDYVFYQGYYYTCIQTTTGNAPPGGQGNNAYWAYWAQDYRPLDPVPVPTATLNAYSAATQYAVGDYVFFSAKYYINVLPSKGNAPTGAFTNNTWWNYIEYDPAKTNYKAGDLITYVGFPYVPFWKCVKSNPPANNLGTAGVTARFGQNEFWQPLYWTPQFNDVDVPFTGLASISAALDMVDYSGGRFLFPYPDGIPPQPFNPEPHRLLNSILGFTWNGVFTPSELSIIYDDVTISYAGVTSQLVNRIRPLPIYYRDLPTAYGLTVDPGSIQDTFLFTANGYANLVYTNVVYIYTTIVGGSTLDTQRNTSLIATASANAGNLGIGFAANYIDTKLRTNGADIYSIGIELRDEVGDPYILTNNANSSFTFKLTYKERPLENKE